jgi:hypothetical protein
MSTKEMGGRRRDKAREREVRNKNMQNEKKIGR